MIEHRSPISGVAAFEARYVATAGYDNQVILWDAASQRGMARGLHDHLANQVRFSPCGRFLVSSSSDGSARLWEVPSMRLVRLFGDHGDDVEAVAFHPTESFVATASRDKLARVFAFDGTVVAVLSGHTADVISVEWTSDGREVVTSSDDGTVKRWDAFSGELLADTDLGGCETDTIVIAASGVIYAGNDDGDIVVIRRDGRQQVPAHRSGVKRLVYHEANRALISLSYDRSVRIWRVVEDGNLECVATTDLPSVVWPRSCAFIGASRVAFATFGTTYAVLALESMTWETRIVAPTPGINATAPFRGRIYAIGDAGMLTVDGEPVRALPSLCNFLCAAGDVLVTGGQTGEIFDALTGRRLHQHRSPLNCAVAFRKDDLAHVIVGAYTGEGVVLRLGPGDRVEHIDDLPLHQNAVKGLATDGDMLFSVCATGASAFRRLTDFARVGLEGAHAKIANGCTALGPGRFASVSRDLTLRLWSGDIVQEYATPHTFSIKCAAASAAGDVVATGSYGGYVALFHVASRRWYEVCRPTTSGISSLAFDADRSVFLASSYDGRIYEIPQSVYHEVV